MSLFWETFADADARAIETLGEEVTLDGVAASAIVDPVAIEERLGAGGRRVDAGSVILVAAGTALRDGMPVQVRGQDGRVDSWEAIGSGSLLVTVGPFNRWSGDIPGV
jgi:hypothetical protein